MKKPFPLFDWIEKHRMQLKPPVGNKLLFEDAEFIVMAVGGPNARTDYHVDEGEEFFYQIEGDIVLKTIQNDQPIDIPIRAGEVFLLPPRIPHSPQRPANSIGLVIERKRATHERDGFEWYCPSCHHKIFEKYLFITDIVKQLPPVFDEFYQNIENRTCKKCGTIVERPQS